MKPLEPISAINPRESQEGKKLQLRDPEGSEIEHSTRTKKKKTSEAYQVFMMTKCPTNTCVHAMAPPSGGGPGAF